MFDKNKKCNSITKIPLEILKLLAPIISLPLFNNSFHQGIFPRLLKKAVVIPVFLNLVKKNDDKIDSNDCRPIPLLPYFCKCLKYFYIIECTSTLIN